MSRGRGRGRGRGPAGLDAALPEDVKASWHGKLHDLEDGRWESDSFFPPIWNWEPKGPEVPQCHVSTQEIAGLIKGLLTNIGIP